MSEHRVIRDFTKAKHGRLSKVDHEPEGKKTENSDMSNSFFFYLTTSTDSVEI